MQPDALDQILHIVLQVEIGTMLRKKAFLPHGGVHA